MDPNIVASLFGLAGVLVGGIISTATTVILSRRTETVAKQKEERDRVREIKRAARLIAADFTTAVALCESTLESKRRVRFPHNPIRLDAWHENRSTIAAEMAAQEWLAITVAFTSMEHLHSFYDQGEAGESETVEETGIRAVTSSRDDVEAGLAVLRVLGET